MFIVLEILAKGYVAREKRKPAFQCLYLIYS